MWRNSLIKLENSSSVRTRIDSLFTLKNLTPFTGLELVSPHSIARLNILFRTVSSRLMLDKVFPAFYLSTLNFSTDHLEISVNFFPPKNLSRTFEIDRLLL